MYETDYFIRFIEEPAHAQADLERGHSFAMYLFFDSEREAREFGEDMGLDTDTIVPFERHGATVYGFALDGLCGFGPYESVEEAEAEARRRGGYNDAAYRYAAIYTGRYAGQADCGDGDMFRPRQLVKVIEL